MYYYNLFVDDAWRALRSLCDDGDEVAMSYYMGWINNPEPSYVEYHKDHPPSAALIAKVKQRHLLRKLEGISS